MAGGGKHPTSMSVATTNLADRVTNSVQRAFSLIQDGIGLARPQHEDQLIAHVTQRGCNSFQHDPAADPYERLRLAEAPGHAASEHDTGEAGRSG